MRIRSSFAALFAALAAGLAAQTPPTAAPKPAAAKPVAPYSAELTTESTTTLPNGTQRVTRSLQRMDRDAAGRTRRELQSDSSDTITILDPVAKVEYTLDALAQTAEQRPYAKPDTAPGPLPPSSDDQLGLQTVTQPLGEQMILGVKAVGTRITTTRPATALLPEWTSTQESWVAPELDLQLRNSSVNPQYALRTETTRLSLSAPPASLFRLPPEYAVRDAAAAAARRPQLFAEAKAALAGVPDEARPGFLGSIATLEFSRSSDAAQSKQALADFNAEFEQALALPASGMSEPDEDALRMAMKANLEQQAATGEDRGDAAAALRMARRADADPLARAQIYSIILAGLREPAPGSGSLDPLSLAQECHLATGAFPYGGAATALRGAALAADARLALLRAGYEAAASETVAAASVPNPYWTSLAEFLKFGHGAAPQLDPELETALLALLPQFAALSASSPATRLASSFLELLVTVDPDRADGFQLLLPAAAAAAAASAASRPRQPIIAPPQDPATQLAQALALTDPVPRFNALVRQVEADGHSNVALAGQAATAALAMLSPDLIAGDTPACIALAQALFLIHQTAAAADLILRCLDETDRQTLIREQQQPAQTYLQWVIGLQGLTYGSARNAYVIAVAIDPAAAIAHAEKLQDPIYKPMALATVAAWSN